MNRFRHTGLRLVLFKNLISFDYHLVAFTDCLRILNMILRVNIQEVIVDSNLVSFEVGDGCLIQLQN